MSQRRLLQPFLDAHGGLERWQRVESISAEVRSGGLLPRAKLKGRALAEYRLTVSTRAQRAVLDPYPRPGRRGVFEGDAVRITSAEGEILAERSGARRAFLGLTGRLRRAVRWDDLDALYFAGYAMWNYLNLPFLLTLPGVEVAEADPLPSEEGWRRLEARFRGDVHTHCERQSFHFDGEGRLRRHDYAPDVVAPFARAAHRSDDYVEAGGIAFPTRRRVVPIARPTERTLSGPTMVRIDLSSIEVD